MAMLSQGPLTVPEFVPVMNGLPAQLESGEWQGKALADCREIVLADIAENFRAKHAPDGTPWRPRKNNLPHPLLILSSLMFQAAVGSGQGHIDRVGDGELEIGIDASAFPKPYPAWHQHGTSKMPARPFIGLSDRGQADCTAVIAEHLNQELFG